MIQSFNNIVSTTSNTNINDDYEVISDSAKIYAADGKTLLVAYFGDKDIMHTCDDLKVINLKDSFNKHA